MALDAFNESIGKGHTDVGEPVAGRYEAIDEAAKSLALLWSDPEFVKEVKRLLKKPKSKRADIPMFNGLSKKASPPDSEEVDSGISGVI